MRQSPPSRRRGSDAPRGPGPLRRFLTSNFLIAVVAMGAIGAGVMKLEFGGSEPPPISQDGALSANDALTLLNRSTLEPVVADAVAAAKKRAHDKQVAIEKKAREKRAWYLKHKKEIDAKNAAARLAKLPNPTSEQNKDVGRRLNELKGWKSCWPSLLILWTKESGWNERADNPWSDAYGIPQALPGSKMASAGPNWQTNAHTQIAWGLGYIGARYGDPCKAWAFWQRNNWY